MSSLVVKGSVFVNPKPIVQVLAKKYGKTTSFTDLVPKIKEGEVIVDPGKYLECITHGRLQTGKVGLGDIEEQFIDYLSSSDAHMIYHGALLKEAVKIGQEVTQVVYNHNINFRDPGDTYIIASDEGNVTLAFPSCEIEVLGKGGRGLVSLHGFNQQSPGGGRIEITHIGGFDKEVEIYIPTHIESQEEGEEGNLQPAVLTANVQLPEKPNKKIVNLSCSIENNAPAILDIGKLGLRVPLGDPIFTVHIMYGNGSATSYVLDPRIIHGLIVEPQDLGRKLKVSLASKTKETEKIILTHLYDKDDNAIPVKLTVNISA